MKYPITFLAAFIVFASFTFLPPANNSVGNGLTLTASNKTAKVGSEVCLDISARDFNQILSMQYTLKWNAKDLKFKTVRKFGLPGLTEQNFGQNNADKGFLTFSWYDQNLRSITVPDGTNLYQICFDVAGKAGQKAYLEFTGMPTSVEISNMDGGLLDLNGVPGVVKIQ